MNAELKTTWFEGNEECSSISCEGNVCKDCLELLRRWPRWKFLRLAPSCCSAPAFVSFAQTASTIFFYPTPLFF